jgi:flagellar biosynthesis/type III secretory pathway protein FliH
MKQDAVLEHTTANSAQVSASMRIKQFIAKRKITLLRKSVSESAKISGVSCQTFISQWQNLLSKLNEKKIDAILEYAQTLITTHLQTNPEAVVAMTIKLLKNIAEHTDVEISAHSAHASIIRSSLREISVACASTRKVAVVEDDALGFGSIIIKANKSVLDAQLKTQLDRAKELLLESLESKNGAIH